MGSKSSRVVQVNSIVQLQDQFQTVDTHTCNLYGTLYTLRSLQDSSEFTLAGPYEKLAIHPMSLHTLIEQRHKSTNSQFLIVPEFSLLQHQYSQSLKYILELIREISELAMMSHEEGWDVGFGWGRIGFSKRWGIVGTRASNWPYQTILRQGKTQGIYLSPQLMLSLSQRRLYPKHNSEKSDVFALGIMLIEIIVQQKLSWLFDYKNYEIKLKPLLERLTEIRNQHGKDLYELLIAMIEISEDQRLGWSQIIRRIDSITRTHTRSFKSVLGVSKTSRQSTSPISRVSKLSPHKSPASRKPRGCKSPLNRSDKQNIGSNKISPLRRRQ